MKVCKWEGCLKSSKRGHGFCETHLEEAIARLFPNHPKQGQPYPMKKGKKK